jgi:hypothetical protein
MVNMLLLLFILQSVLPIARASSQVHDSQDHNGGRFDGIQKAKRKSLEKSAANPLFKYGGGLRIARQGVRCQSDFM